jgi:amidohydrolase
MTQQLKEKAWKSIREQEGKLRDLALYILDHPELGYRERESSKALVDVLSEAGFETQQPYGGLETAFYASKTVDPAPVITFLAEYDALPGVGHGCGHNLIGTAAAAAALGASAVLEDTGGTVSVMGTPAEEYRGEEEGKIKLIRAGAFEDVTVALMLHPYYHRQVMGSDLGFIACDFHFQGQSAHAAADPWNGRNALDGLLATFNNINALRQQVQPDVRIHGVITEGGKAPNLIPDCASAQFMVRAGDPDTLERVYERVCDCARAGALSSGTELEIDQITTVYNTRINETLNRLVAQNFASLGQPLDPEPYEMAASSDFGNVSQEVPAAMFMIDSHPEGMPWHTTRVAEASGEEKALRAMITGASVMAGVAIDLLTDEELLAQVQKDYQGND